MLHWINQLLTNLLRGLFPILAPLHHRLIGTDRRSSTWRIGNCVAIEIDVLVGITTKAASPCTVPCIRVYTLQRGTGGGGKGDMKGYGNQWDEAGTHRGPRDLLFMQWEIFIQTRFYWMNQSLFDIFAWVWSTQRTRCALLFCDIYRPQGKVIFPAEVSVSHSVHRVGLHSGGFASRRGLYPGVCLQGVCWGGGSASRRRSASWGSASGDVGRTLPSQ